MRQARTEHTFEASLLPDTCMRCSMREAQHRKRERKHSGPSGKKRHPKSGEPGYKSDLERTKFIGIDGEGRGREDHKYFLLAASYEPEHDDGGWHVKPSAGRGRLTTRECLDFILTLPTRRTKIFSFSFNYDITKILTDLPNEALYHLFRPELRPGKFGPKAVRWCADCSAEAKGIQERAGECENAAHGPEYRINLQGTKFSVARGSDRVIIWDLFKFFQGKFLTAIKDWKVGSQELWDRIEFMKERRNEFDKESDAAILKYCLEETTCIAQLARRLIESHESVGLKLRSYYGAGSSGAAMLTAMSIKEKLAPVPPPMKSAVAAAFAGGRFENSVIGTVPEALSNFDISSAYVYQLAFLPCLEHGRWFHTRKRKELEKAEAQSGALVRYALGINPGYSEWGPFPFRTEDGSISFPIESGGGWVWLSEYLQGERLFRHVQFREAWVYQSNCQCQPFKKISEYYNLRLKIGKEGPGIVIKLGMNSCYGKLAQSVGNAIFSNWIWAGMITSGTRAQLLELMGMHENRADVLMMATDGLLTRDKAILPPVPLDTGTGATGKPLGGWERKPADKGMFIARPGIYFPLDPSEDELAQVRARGVGRGVVLRHWRTIIDAWNKDGVDGIARVDKVSRFCGGKTCTSLVRGKYKRANGKNNLPAYGQWISREVGMGFDPLPKRERVNRDGLTLELRKFSRDLESLPYDRAMALKSTENQELKAATLEAMEQPDGDLTEYEGGML